jgi:chemotaxis protein CheD
MNKIVVGIGEGKVAVKDQVLISYALGSCVGICLYDKEKQMAGMAHIVLPGKADSMNQDNVYKFADEGTRALIQAMILRGADRKKMTAKLAGGAKMFETKNSKWEIGQKNVEMVKKVLEEERIKIIGEDTGKNYGRTISLYAKTGILLVNTVRHKEIRL